MTRDCLLSLAETGQAAQTESGQRTGGKQHQRVRLAPLGHSLFVRQTIGEHDAKVNGERLEKQFVVSGEIGQCLRLRLRLRLCVCAGGQWRPLVARSDHADRKSVADEKESAN